jgi:hypothetical protein
MNEPISTCSEERASPAAPMGQDNATQPTGMNGARGPHDGSSAEPNRSTGAAPAADGAAQASTPPPQVARAEEMVDRLAERAAQFTSVWGRRLARVVGRVKEEAQDMWAEAQSIRRGDQP